MARKTLYLIWDFDGTLYDAYPSMAAALLSALETFGVNADVHEIYGLIKRTLYHGVCTLAVRHGLDADALLAAFRAAHHAQGRMPLMPHAEACLAETARLGCKHCLFTHRDRAAVAMLQADGLDHYFSDVVTRENGFADKPLARSHSIPDAKARVQRLRSIHGRRPVISTFSPVRRAGAQGILFDPEGFYPNLAAEHRIASLATVADIMRQRLAEDKPSHR